MIRRELSLLCVSLLVWVLLAAPAGAAEQPSNAVSTARERIAEISSGAIIEVKLHKQPKVRGRLGSVTDSGFELQHLKNDKMQTETIAFQDVKSVKVVGQGMHVATKIVIGTLIGAGVIFLIGLAACLAGGCDT